MTTLHDAITKLIPRVPLIYIAGPFRGPTPWAVEQNVRRIETVGLDVARLGGYPIMPQANTRFFDKLLTDKFWLEGTLACMARCDMLVMAPMWQESTGAKHERDVWIATHDDIDTRTLFYLDGEHTDELALQLAIRMFRETQESHS